METKSFPKTDVQGGGSCVTHLLVATHRHTLLFLLSAQLSNKPHQTSILREIFIRSLPEDLWTLAPDAPALPNLGHFRPPFQSSKTFAFPPHFVPPDTVPIVVVVVCSKQHNFCLKYFALGWTIRAHSFNFDPVPVWTFCFWWSNLHSEPQACRRAEVRSREYFQMIKRAFFNSRS